MSREHKYRIWEDHQKKYFYFQDIGITGNLLSFDCQADDFSESLFSWDNAEIEQYTGLKDKNGKEIYEGDIVITENLDEGENNDLWNRSELGKAEVSITEEFGVVMSETGHYQWSWNDPKSVYCLNFIEIIGNIHE